MSSRELAQRVQGQLREKGYQAFFAGGCVRDLLLGRLPADYDVATDATPDTNSTTINCFHMDLITGPPPYLQARV